MRHGGNLHEAESLFPEAPLPWIDLSTGINPHAYPFTMPHSASFARLPAPEELRETEQIAAKAYGVAEARRVTAGPGSQAFIQLLPRLRKTSRVAILGPTYSEHEAAWIGNDHDVVHVSDVPQALAANADVVVVVNPNNPDGRVVSREDLAAAASGLQRRSGWLIVDEAFADLEDDVSVASLDLPSTIILRSFGKAYGLAGVRLGFSIADPDVSEKIKVMLGSWPVSGPTLEIGREALADATWLSHQQELLQSAATALDHQLAIAGFSVTGGTRLFRFASHPSAAAMFSRLARNGIWVRQFDHAPQCLRFGIPLEADKQRIARRFTAF